MKFDRSKVVMFRLMGNITLGMTEDGTIGESGKKFETVYAPRVCFFQENPTDNKIHLNIMTYGLISTEIFLSELVTNETYNTKINVDLIESIYDGKQIGNSILNKYTESVSPVQTTSILDGKVGDIQSSQQNASKIDLSDIEVKLK